MRPGLIGALALALLAGMAPGAARGQAVATDQEPVRQEVSEGKVRITLEADRQTMPIDGRLGLRLVVEAPVGMAVDLPASVDRLGPFVVVSQTAEAPAGDASEVQRWRRHYVLEAEDVGELTLPPLTIAISDPAGSPASARSLQTRPLGVTVTSVLPAEVDLTEFKDIAPPVELSPAGRSWLVWALVGLSLAAGLALAIRRRRRRAAPPPMQPAHLLALAELERLERRLAAERPGIEEVYVRLAEILRRYLVWRFGLSAPTQTTEELLAAVERTGGPIAARRQLIGRLLAECDLVKFARQRPAPARAQGSLRLARAFVEQTADPQVLVGPAAAKAF